MVPTSNNTPDSLKMSGFAEGVRAPMLWPGSILGWHFGSERGDARLDATCKTSCILLLAPCDGSAKRTQQLAKVDPDRSSMHATLALWHDCADALEIDGNDRAPAAFREVGGTGTKFHHLLAQAAPSLGKYEEVETLIQEVSCDICALAVYPQPVDGNGPEEKRVQSALPMPVEEIIDRSGDDSPSSKSSR